jgi:hypothetical protein
MTETKRAARREGCYVCGRCGTRHAHAAIHDDGAPVCMGDKPELARQILEAFATITGHMSPIQTLPAVNPRSQTDLRTSAGRAWLERELETQYLMIELERAGYLVAVNERCGPPEDAAGDRGYPWGFAISAAGRALLAGERGVT